MRFRVSGEVAQLVVAFDAVAAADGIADDFDSARDGILDGYLRVGRRGLERIELHRAVEAFRSTVEGDVVGAWSEVRSKLECDFARVSVALHDARRLAIDHDLELILLRVRQARLDAGAFKAREQCAA